MIITGWGGHLDYLGQDYPGLVRYEMTQVEGWRPESVYRPTQRWATADRQHAVQLMRGAVARDRGLFEAAARLRGAIAEMIEANGKSTKSAFDATGNLVCVTPSSYAASSYRCASTTRSAYQVAMEYDLRGRKTKMADPDMGTWTYAFNGAGELTSQTDPNGATTTQVYDGLGRMAQRSEQRGATSFVTSWTYDNAASCSILGLTKTGKLCSQAVTGGASKAISYDDQGRAYRTTTTVVDTGNVSHVFDNFTLYDPKNRPSYFAYPQVAGNVPPYAVRESYNAAGYLNQVTEAVGGTVLWQGTSRYDDGQAYQSSVGGVTVTRGYDALSRVASIVTNPSLQNAAFGFDFLGNLTSRSDTRGDSVSYSETFGYDALNRVSTETCSNSAVCGSNRSFGYDDFGNLTSKAGTSIGVAAGSHRVSGTATTLQATCSATAPRQLHGRRSTCRTTSPRGRAASTSATTAATRARWRTSRPARQRSTSGISSTSSRSRAEPRPGRCTSARRTG